MNLDIVPGTTADMMQIAETTSENTGFLTKGKPHQRSTHAKEIKAELDGLQIQNTLYTLYINNQKVQRT